MSKTKKIYIITISDAVLYLFSVLLFLITKTELALTIWELVTTMTIKPVAVQTYRCSTPITIPFMFPAKMPLNNFRRTGNCHLGSR